MDTGPSPNEIALTALTACVRRACGVPSVTPVGQRASPVSASVFGDPASRSHAIVLRLGSAKLDSILWVSPRGGLLCSCFGGTQNALVVSVSSRSSDCKHVELLRRALAASGVPLRQFRGRMRLAPDAKNYATCKQYGAAVLWVSLYQKVYSLVTFSAASAATCLAPCCRRFGVRCGHVKLVRPLHLERLAEAGAAATAERDVGTAIKAAAVPSARRRFLSSEEEDAGIEKLPSDTSREKSDSPEETVAARNPRNLLPGMGEMAEAEVWARTADWKKLHAAPVPTPKEAMNENSKRLAELISFLERSGNIRDMTNVLV